MCNIITVRRRNMAVPSELDDLSPFLTHVGGGSVQKLIFDLFQVNLLSRLDHPCIVSYFDSFEEDGILMIEMEYADGG